MSRNLALLACASLFSLLLLEAGIGLGARFGLFRIKVPSYSIAQARSPIFWRDVDPVFGAWHNPNSLNRHLTACFDVTYRSNSYGARDSERARQSDRPRVVVLGDSMVEGYGVAAERRLTELLERDTGIEHLNFGMNANFGTTQYYLLYKTLVAGFDHAAVIVGMIPTNDFRDNDLEFGKYVYRDRYRPYLVGEYPSYRLVYHQPSIEQSVYRDRPGFVGLTQRMLSEFTYTYNAFSYFRLLIAMRSNPDFQKDLRPERTEEYLNAEGRQDKADRPYSGYYDYRKEDLDLVKYAYEQIHVLAGRRPVVIVLLPTPTDFQRYDPARPAPLSVEMERFASARGMTFIDLLPDMYRHEGGWQRLILSCDNHWNERGHAAAAQHLKARLAPLYGRGLAAGQPGR